MSIRPATSVSAPKSCDVQASDRLYCTPIAQTSLVSYRPLHAELQSQTAQTAQAHRPDALGAAQHHRGLRRTVAVMFHHEPPRILVHPPTPPSAALKLPVSGADHAIKRPASAPPVLQAADVQVLEVKS